MARLNLGTKNRALQTRVRTIRSFWPFFGQKKWPVIDRSWPVKNDRSLTVFDRFSCRSLTGQKKNGHFMVKMAVFFDRSKNSCRSLTGQKWPVILTGHDRSNWLFYPTPVFLLKFWRLASLTALKRGYKKIFATRFARRLKKGGIKKFSRLASLAA